MENTLENKAKFFAQYWSQEVLITPHLIYTGNPPEPSHDEWGEDVLNETNIVQVLKHNFPIWLTPLSQISDEDALWAAKEVFLDRYFKETPKSELVEEIKKTGIRVTTPYRADYLRSKGYALEWLGVSVEKQIEYGWVKLKTYPNAKR